MELISDILLVAGALGAGLYCFVLARRLKRFTDLERGVGGAVSVLSVQAEELRKSLDAARTASDQSGQKLQDLTGRAETVAQRLELIMASMHDVVPEDRPESSPPVTDPETSAVSAEDKKEAESPTPASDQPKKMQDTSDATPFPKGVMFFRHMRQTGEAQKG